MKIIDIQEKTFSISSDIKNAYISFAKMDCSVVAIPAGATLTIIFYYLFKFTFVI